MKSLRAALRPPDCARLETGTPEGQVDVLSDLLKLVTLKGAVYYHAEFSAPWTFRAPESRALTPFVRAEGHIVTYHLLLGGEAWAQTGDGPRVRLRAGDIVILPHGDPHRLGNGPDVEPIGDRKALARIFSRGLEPERIGGGGDVTKFVCGFMCCDPHMGQLLLAGLPPLLTVNIREGAGGAWLENAILFSVANAGSLTAGGEAVLAKLSEALFVETLRRYLASLPPTQTGWLAGARDAEVGKALGLIHNRPAHPWTIADLASEVGVSRAVLAERFREILGEPPIAYLTRWRLNLGARLLVNSSRGVAEIAAEVGYESEAAFNRAFKRVFGDAPARYRKGARSVSAHA
jgi:AraC-like DNA-binding protein